jgi:citrate synthase
MAYDYFERMRAVATMQNEIDRRLYGLFQVKNGLRNANGSGVLVGLTNISTVVGYEKIDEQVVPIDGKLYYRGFDVEELIKAYQQDDRFGFEETAYLLLFGVLPNPGELGEFSARLGEMRVLPKDFPRDVLMTFHTRDIMNALARSVLTFYSMDPLADDLAPANQVRQAMELTARVQPIVPWAYYIIQQGVYDGSLILHRPDPKLSTAENLLAMLRPTREYSDLEAKTLDAALVLHADHGGGNNSTFTARVVSSTGTDIYSAIGAAIGSLKGPLHGGANAQVVAMMRDIRASVANPFDRDQLRAYLFKVLRKEVGDRSGKIYGFGHAVYTRTDPRAIILREYARKLAEHKGRQEEFAVYETVEREARALLVETKKANEKPVCSNVDFYSGFVYDCLGIPHEVFTPLFALSRMAGWVAHRVELMTNEPKIVRPAYKYIGRRAQPYQPMSER